MKQDLLRFIESHGRDGDFESLALALFAWQVARNPDYAALADGAQPTTWRDLPAVPVRLFRDLPFTSFPPEDAQVVFRTSGTTGGRGVVRLRDTALYDAGARAHAEAVVGPIPEQGASLVGRAPDSSLAHMCWAFAPGLVSFFDADRGVRGADLVAWLDRLDGPCFVPGTAFAFAELVEQIDRPIALAPGSIVMVTGGFKGRAVRLSPDHVQARLRALFPGARLVGEYGMSELASQLWSPQLGGAFVPPPWLRVCAVDPLTGAPQRAGLLRFVDLASLDTVVAIETGDLGVVHDDGSVELRGRHAGAPLRGCSLTVEEALAPAPPAARLHALVDPPVQGLTPASPIGRWAAGPDPSGDPARIDRVLRGLARLRRLDAGPLSQGLSPENAAECMGLALSAVTAEGLRASLHPRGARPPDVTVVVAAGVFTSPIEWAALYAAAGMSVHLKAPALDPGLCEVLAAALQQEGLPVTCSTDRDLGQPAAVVAFGSDATVAAVRAAHPRARVVGFGHRFSAALCVADPSLAQGIGWEHALYDTRGCMAPAAVFVLGDPAPLHDALAEAMPLVEAALPVGPPDPALGPEWRRRLGLARATGRVTVGSGWAVATVPPDRFIPAALPRLVSLVPIDGGAHLHRILEPWRPWLSSLSTDDLRRPIVAPAEWGPAFAAFPRHTTLGSLQRPGLPRHHDGRSMLGCLLQATAR